MSPLTATFTAQGYTPEMVKTRYVRISISGDRFEFCEVGEDRRYDLRQGVVNDPSIIPAEIRTLAEQLRNAAFQYVEWPL